jgi:hypothetical protein
VRRIGLVALALLFVPLIALGPRPATAAPPPEVLLVGDSVMNGMAQTYGATSRAQLAARHTFVLDTKGCRRLITTSCRIGTAPTPTNAITTIRSMAGRYRTAIVVGAGYNDPTNGSIGVNTAIDVILREARRQHVPYVVWLTYRVAGPSASRFAAHNALLRRRAASEPMLVIADWAMRSAPLPTSWFSGDGIHLGRDATIAMADLIGDTIDQIERPWGGSHCVVTPTTNSPIVTAASTPPVRSVNRTASGGRPAARVRLWCPR